MIKSVDANSPHYWQSVRDNATRRRALDMVKQKFKTLHISQIFEQHLDRCFRLVEWAARTEGFFNVPDQFNQFKQECSDFMGMCEIVEWDRDEVESASTCAVIEAHETIYGAGRSWVYGNGIEPGGMPLDSELEYEECDTCGKQAIYQYWQELEGGSVNSYTSTHCNHCGESKSTCI